MTMISNASQQPRSLFPRTVLSGLALSILGLSVSAQASDGWQFQLTPYLWLPTIEGKANYSVPPSESPPDVEVGPTDWLDLLNAAFLLNGSARKGKFSLTGDLVYLGLESDNDKVIDRGNGISVNSESEFDGGIAALMAGYTVVESDHLEMNIVAGVRYFKAELSTGYDITSGATRPNGQPVIDRSRKLKGDEDIIDGIVGVRGAYRFGVNNRWSLPYHVDVGAGDSDLTWQLIAGAAYTYDWGDLMLVYRHLAYDQGNDGLLEDFSFSGPAFGARFRF